jgi:KaiC/GvpD/RAD55 family RecA-like ATPase
MPQPSRRSADDILAEARAYTERHALSLTPPTIDGDEAAEQFDEARRELWSAPDVLVRFPYESVHAMAGNLAPGMLAFVTANTGHGKTTFLLDVLDRWAERSVRVYYLGTEQEPNELIRKWAALRADVHAGVVIGKEWDEHLQGAAWRERVEREVTEIETRFGEQVHFCPNKFIDQARIVEAARAAEAIGAHVLVIDHIDRVDVGAGENEYTAQKRLVRRLKELARDHGLVLLVASQLNREGRKADRLGAYRAPQLHQMQGGATKEQEADVVLGLWRPLRQQRSGETSDEYKRVVAAAQAGNGAVSEVTEPNTMAVVLLKHRTHGEREGQRCKLSVHHGRLADIPERDQYGTRPAELP